MAAQLGEIAEFRGQAERQRHGVTQQQFGKTALEAVRGDIVYGPAVRPVVWYRMPRVSPPAATGSAIAQDGEPPKGAFGASGLSASIVSMQPDVTARASRESIPSGITSFATSVLRSNRSGTRPEACCPSI